ncbi:putative vascular endothelial growth factor receptor 1-like [Apostichopus japonicus]|uniref:Putative vascular endothelial growth factor receptor 1-like n=1 Tax=Stichopus japonicus TaxID=307972 RepID=A0A2G8LN22_STIJA|nr:putative vascular endothelial growth factor receptor 1-like [Apostichopus japonicus]
MVFITATCCLRATIRKRKAAHRSDELLSDIKSQSIHRISGGKIEEVSGVPDIVFKNRELDRSLLQLDRELGSGQFGVVYKAYAFGVDGSNEFVPVAVKCLKENADFGMKEDFLDEIRLLIEIDSHPNILSVLGCCTIEEPCYLITEYMRYGDLLRFLWKSREERYRIQDAVYNITQENRLQIARQIARGMEYLSKTRYYHGDLAARNILVGENLVVKISDFGLADDIYQAGYKRLSPDKKRPVKWVSLETNTTGKCTIQSDVWSYGIVLYEIYTSGGVPYPGMSGRELIQKLQDGYRLESPEECPDELYEVMLSCWQVNPSDRPTFNTLYRIMDCLLAEQSDYLATEEERSARILPLIKTTSLSSGPGPDKDVPLVPERPRETLGEEEGGEEGERREMGDEGEKQDISVEAGKSKVQELTPNGSQDVMIGRVNEAYDPDVEGSGGGSSLETFLAEDDRII